MARGEMELIVRTLRMIGRTLDRVWSEFIVGEEIASIFLAFGLLTIAIMIVCWGGYFLWNKMTDPMLEKNSDPFLKKINQKLKQ